MKYVLFTLLAFVHLSVAANNLDVENNFNVGSDDANFEDDEFTFDESNDCYVYLKGTWAATINTPMCHGRKKQFEPGTEDVARFVTEEVSSEEECLEVCFREEYQPGQTKTLNEGPGIRGKIPRYKTMMIDEITCHYGYWPYLSDGLVPHLKNKLIRLVANE